MRHSVTKKQFNARMCFVCGLDNSSGLHARYYELDSAQVVAVVKPHDIHQSYPNRMHGGIITAILDETIGRAVMIEGDVAWGVTVEFTTRYRKPVPLDVELRALGRIAKSSPRGFEGTGELLLPDGTVAAEGFGRYMRIPLDRITDASETDNWITEPEPEDPADFDLPDREG
jgi:acyl-coenzyme A thioesterase PaaI-like protein